MKGNWNQSFRKIEIINMNKLIAIFLLVLMVGVVYSELDKYGCYWSGSSPICRGSCREGFITNKTSTKGDFGEHECVTGKKKYCCQVGFVPNASTGTIIVLHTNTDSKP